MASAIDFTYVEAERVPEAVAPAPPHRAWDRRDTALAALWGLAGTVGGIGLLYAITSKQWLIASLAWY